METSWIDHFLIVLGRTSYEAAIVAVLVAAAQRAFRWQLTPRWRCALWLLVAGRLLLPFSLGSAASVFNLLPNWKAPNPPTVEPQTPATVVKDEVFATPTNSVPVIRGYSQKPMEPVAKARGRWRWQDLAFATWLSGAAVITARVLVSSLRFRRKCTGSKLAGESAVSILRDCCLRLGIRKPPSVYESYAVSTPALYGLFRPRLLLPERFAHGFCAAELRFVFLHELAHLKRRDLPMNWLLTALQAVHWFNPLVLFSFARWRTERELACDTIALEIAGHEQSQNYGRTILRLLEGDSRHVSAPGLVGILEDKQQLRQRIEMIAGYIPTRGWPRLALLLMAALSVAGLTDARSPNEQKGNDMKIRNALPQAGLAGLLAMNSATGAAVASDDVPAVAQQIIGTWVLVGEPGKTGKAPSAGGRYKFFTGDHWCITQADPANGVVLFHHGGSYKFDGGDYVESLGYANPSTMDRIGDQHRYKLTVVNGVLSQIGIDNKLQEAWQRVKPKSIDSPAPLAANLIGTWVLTSEQDKEVSDETHCYKFITDSSWCDTSYYAKNQVVVFHHGGLFSLQGNRYVEHVAYANPTSMGLIGQSSKFNLTIEGDTLKLDGIGNPWKEVWKRVAVQADSETPELKHKLSVTPKIKRAFRSGDSIEIRSITGTAPKFETGGTYRVIGTGRQQTLKNAILYLGNTAEPGSEAIVATTGSSLSQPLPSGTTAFDITFKVLRPGLLHVTIYDMDNHDKNDNAYAGIYLGEALLRR